MLRMQHAGSLTLHPVSTLAFSKKKKKDLCFGLASLAEEYVVVNNDCRDTDAD